MARGKLSKQCHIRGKPQQTRTFQTSRPLRPSYNQGRRTTHQSNPRKSTLFDPIPSDATACCLRGNQPRSLPAPPPIRTTVPYCNTFIGQNPLAVIFRWQLRFCRKAIQDLKITLMCESLYRAESKLVATPWVAGNLLTELIESNKDFVYSKEEKEDYGEVVG